VVDTRTEFEHLAGIYVAVAVAVVVLVIGAIVFVVVRLRRLDSELPAQRAGAPRLELLYASGLSIVVVALLVDIGFPYPSQVWYFRVLAVVLPVAAFFIVAVVEIAGHPAEQYIASVLE
jgi:hypothetical protein